MMLLELPLHFKMVWSFYRLLMQYLSLQASQIVQLIVDYQKVVLGKVASSTSVIGPDNKQDKQDKQDKPSKVTKKKRTEHRTTTYVSNNEQETKL